MLNKDLYFDWAASSLCDEEILKAAFDKSLELFGNPSSIHKAGREANKVLQECRQRCADILGVNSECIYFTSGGTESDYLPIISLLERPVKGSVVVSAIEHPAVREQINQLKKCGWKINVAQSTQEGIITADAVEKAMDADTALVCVMAANNETGAINDIYAISDRITKLSEGKKRPKFHVDAVQAFGKIPLDLSYKGIDTAAISGHKIRGPRGIGIMYMAQRQEPFLRGGGQESGIRSGTENLYGILAITECLEKYCAKKIVEENFNKQNELTSRFIKKLSDLKGITFVPECRSHDDMHYSPYCLQAAFKNIPGEVMVRALSDQGIYISTGSACSARKQNRPILDAMKISKDISSNAVRFSFGYSTTVESIDKLFTAVSEINSLFNP